MNRTTRFLSLILAVLLLFPWTASAAGAEIISDIPIDAEKDPLLVAQLESQAIDYVTKYVNTAYLYETEDFVSGTLLDVPETVLTQSETAELTVSGTATAVTDLQANLQQFADVAEYYRYIRSAQGYELEDFEINISDVATAINGSSAEVSLYTLITFRYPELDEPSACGDHYTVYFEQIGDEWCIVDIYAEELEAYHLTREHFDCAEAIEQFDSASHLHVSTETEIVSSGQSPSAELTAITPDLGGNNRYSYNAFNAVAYAYTYTTGSYTGDYNNSNFLNGNFGDYTYLGGNCINFASQCVWAGLGGSNTSSTIDSYDLPMDNSGNGIWKANAANWITCSGFLNYIKNYGSSISETTLRATYSTINSNASFSGFTSSELLGAVLLLTKSDANSPYHALFVTSVNGTSRSDVYICGNSPMRKNISVTYGAYASDSICVITPQYLQIAFGNTTCLANGHTFPVAETAVGSYHTVCSVCQYKDLRVVAVQKKPILIGTTSTISGSSNYTCYRMAINITYPDGTSIWEEAYNTSTISYSYTFTKTGLYTITIYARDLNPDAEENTYAVSQTFTVRVYS